MPTPSIDKPYAECKGRVSFALQERIPSNGRQLGVRGERREDMNERGIRVSINSGLTEDEVYEVTRQIKILDGVAAVTLNHQEPHVGLVVLKPGANAAAIKESVAEYAASPG